MWQSFGAFVDVGAERDGFIHVSDISTEFIHQPSDFLRSGDLCFVGQGFGSHE